MTQTVVDSLLRGALVTLVVVAVAVLIATPVALVAGLARLSRLRVVRLVAGVYVEVFRGTSALVQLFWAYFVLPEFGIVLPPLTVGCVVLGLNAGAYGAEIVRGAVNAVPRGQWEALQTLGVGRWQGIRRVVFPQAVPTMLPPAGNTLIDVLKASALVSLITVSDFTRAINQWATTGALDLTLAYTLLLVGYFVMSMPLSGGMRLLERFYRRRLPSPHR
ncbi:ectoine/hydroxyectoine ABC transporter permease subunit EhuC [Dactylosporangium sp. AC04546]|uniref:ectoine/hydroxyectoine ABC transporter permease subunit EhuC n=1 Tax=Dactylosporangium sp. AC04546 TaxID=2862460 RepID=UPI001EDEEECE|nr:ectoine/hydroxyectoine ABC transporter permease subunit EhuC [Dactylosporangium sp. AC04546]WVK86594.1 ectoine/hydroxyectoine ABC transporter permease subunit EhuC [Dactylosporangium sp. AC04546]